MADVNVLDLTNATPGSGDSLILFDRNTGEAKAAQYNTLQSTVLGSKFDDSSPANGDELTYNSSSGKWKNTTKIKDLTTSFSNHEAQNSKNMCINNLLGGGSYRGLTFTPHEDGSITIDGTATGAAYINLASSYFEAFNQNHKKYSCEEIGLDITKDIWLSTGNDSATTGTGISLRLYCYDTDSFGATPLGYFSSGNSSVKNIAATHPTTKYISFALGASENHTMSNVTVYPMMYYNSEPDKSYVPYGKSNRQLTKDTNYLVDNAEVNGAVNMLPFPYHHITKVENGVTFTVNDDGTLTTSGTSTEVANFYFTGNSQSSGLKLKAGSYKLSGNPGVTNLPIQLYDYTSGSPVKIGDDAGNGLYFALSADSVVMLRIRIASGVNTDGYTFKPMITVASYDGDYVPYAKSNKELTEDVEDLKSYYLNDAIPTSLDPNITITRFQRRKIGRLVQICIVFTAAAANNTSTVKFYTLENELQPLMSTYFSVAPYDSTPTSSTGAIITLASSGALSTKCVEAGAKYAMNITYISES